MVISKLYYGLGNQMFQYAGGKALSLRKKCAFKIDISFFDSKHNNSTTAHQQRCHLDVFSNKLPVLKTTFLIKVLNKLNRFFNLKPLYEYIVADDLDFHSEIMNCESKVVCLYALLQNECYFADFAKEIRREFTFKNIDAKNESIGMIMKNEESVSLHIRRGDYVGGMYVIPISYYDRAIEFINCRYENPHYYIFSDDIDWVGKNLTIKTPHTYITYNTGDDSYKDMYLMAQCKHNIIANSSFSWWGAWLNDNKYKTVIAPEVWFPQYSITGSDLVPSSWIKLS